MYLKREENSLEYKRVNDLLQADKSIMSDGCKALIVGDFAEKFDEYFDLTGVPRMEITCKKGVYRVEIFFEAERIKKFNVLK